MKSVDIDLNLSDCYSNNVDECLFLLKQMQYFQNILLSKQNSFHSIFIIQSSYSHSRRCRKLFYDYANSKFLYILYIELQTQPCIISELCPNKWQVSKKPEGIICIPRQYNNKLLNGNF